MFDAGRDEFSEAETVPEGLGPTMNLDGCAGCHLHPAVGGTSPPVNPQVEFARRLGAANAVPPFIGASGPVREARFVKNPDGTPDGGVHSLFTIAGRSDAPGCTLPQQNFAGELARGNVIFRIPTPLFGSGLIEQTPDREIARNLASDRAMKAEYGIGGKPNIVMAFHTISGQPNKNGNDGTFGRFGWKAQNKSLLIFSAEAYNVEMGITNEAFPSERDETTGSDRFAPAPNTVTKLDAKTLVEGLSAIEKFAFFMRFLAAPEPSADRPRGADSIPRPSRFQPRRVRAVPHAEPSDRQHGGGGAAQPDRQALFRPAAARHGHGARRRHLAEPGRAERIPHRATVGPGAAPVLPARRPHRRSARSAPRAREPGVGGECGDPQPRPHARGRQAGSLQLPALAVGAVAHGAIFAAISSTAWAAAQPGISSSSRWRRCTASRTAGSSGTSPTSSSIGAALPSGSIGATNLSTTN